MGNLKGETGIGLDEHRAIHIQCHEVSRAGIGLRNLHSVHACTQSN